MPVTKTVGRTRKRTSGPHNPDTCALALKWSFQLMVDLLGYRKLLCSQGIDEDDLALELGLAEFIEPENYSRSRGLQLLKQEQHAFAQDFPAPQYPEPLGSNLQALGELLELSAEEERLLGFCALLHTDPTLNTCADVLGAQGVNRTMRVLAVVLDIPQGDISRLFNKDATLVRSGLLELDYSATTYSLEQRLVFMSQDFMEQLRFHETEAENLFRHSFRLSAPAQLCIDDYQHVQPAVEMARSYLRKVLRQHQPGVNILLYGPPGTGKTQLCRLLAQELDLELYEIACTNSDGDPIDGRQRLCALRSALTVLQSSQVLIMLDEVEDIFTGQGPQKERAKSNKAWINRTLEENSKPCFWLSNSIECLDAAYIRRFDLVIELPTPTLAQRERIIRTCCDDRLDKQLIDKLSSHEQMTAAVFDRAYRVARTIYPRVGRKLNQTVEYLVDATLKAQGHPVLTEVKHSNVPAFYSPDLINADIELDGLLDGLRRHPEARICFYGPPGTGKSAFGGWLAKNLNKPLHVKRVSDLVSPYVGETEQNMAQAFSRAEEEKAVLLLDEVDSFLQDRSQAKQRWEITGVNEMLTQMENYSGVFIASTNLMSHLDPAALRRFDLKIHFGYLRPEQALSLLRSHLQALALKDPARQSEHRLQGMKELTSGDFASVARRARFKPFTSADAFVSALQGEIALKNIKTSRPIGFIH